jgi:hypothetical protein
MPNYGVQPYPYPQMTPPPMMAQPSIPVSPNIQPTPMAAPIPRRADMTPGSAIPPVAPNEVQKTAHKRTTLSDGTVLPDVIYVKKKGTLIGLIITSVLLVASLAFAVYTVIGNAKSKSEIEALTAENEEQKGQIQIVLNALGLESGSDITEELLKERTSQAEGALDMDLSSFFDNNAGVGVKSIRLSADLRYALAVVNYYGKDSYFYREMSNGGWSQAFSRVDVINCRDITAEAMKVISDLGGVEKSTTKDGKPYDCLDVENNKKPYDFTDALREGIYKE